jgi:uncharacterized protein
MASRKVALPVIEKGWIRALLMVLIYTAMSVIVFTLVSSIELSIFISSIAAILLVFFFRKFIDRRSFMSLGLKLSQIFPDGVIGILIAAAMVCAGSVIIFIDKGLEWTDIFFDGSAIASGIGSMLLVAIAEELVYRGYVLRNLMKSFNRWLALVISAILFTVVHLSNPGIPVLGIINILLGGLVLGIAFMYSKNLWMPIGFHFSWNLVQGPLLGFPVSGFPFASLITMETDPARPSISGGGFGFEGSVICTGLLILLSVVALSSMSKVKPAL